MSIELILSRRSLPLLTDPAPGATQLADALRCALSAPDHRLLRPWRFVCVQGEARAKLGQVFLDAALLVNPDLTQGQRDKLLRMPLRAPLLIVAVCALQTHASVPEVEQLLSTGAAIQNLLLALHGQGYATMWRTGEIASNAQVKVALGLAASDVIAGFVYVGSAAGNPSVRELPALDTLVREWR